MYRAIIDVQPQENYLLLLTFETGEKRQFDLKPYMETGLFKELKDIQLFRTVKPSFDTIAWANEADIDPEFLYEQSRIVA